MSIWGGNFAGLLEKATSDTLVESDLALNLEICDQIRGDHVQPAAAVRAIKERLQVPDPNVVLLTLTVLEYCAKNCGGLFNRELAKEEFVDELKLLVRRNALVRDRVLELLKSFSVAFKDENGFENLVKAVPELTAEGYKFPSVDESAIMFSTDGPPAWVDDVKCYNCRSAFTMINRKHHCRNCGQIFCQSCSSKNHAIPKYGYNDKVRVCDQCHSDLVRGIDRKQQKKDEELKAKREKAAADAKEKEAIDQAIALSLVQQREEEERRQRLLDQYSFGGSSGAGTATATTTKSKQAPPADSDEDQDSDDDSDDDNRAGSEDDDEATEDNDSDAEGPLYDDPALAKYLDRNYWEGKAKGEPEPPAKPAKPSSKTETATAPAVAPRQTATNANDVTKIGSGAAHQSEEADEFIGTIKSNVSMFEERVLLAAKSGRPIQNDSYIQSLFHTTSVMHPQLLKRIGDLEDQMRRKLEVNDKLEKLTDMRANLARSRREHELWLREQEKEQELMRRMQLEERLKQMRQMDEDRQAFMHQTHGRYAAGPGGAAPYGVAPTAFNHPTPPPHSVPSPGQSSQASSVGGGYYQPGQGQPQQGGYYASPAPTTTPNQYAPGSQAGGYTVPPQGPYQPQQPQQPPPQQAAGQVHGQGQPQYGQQPPGQGQQQQPQAQAQAYVAPQQNNQGQMPPPQQQSQPPQQQTTTQGYVPPSQPQAPQSQPDSQGHPQQPPAAQAQQQPPQAYQSTVQSPQPQSQPQSQGSYGQMAPPPAQPQSVPTPAPAAAPAPVPSTAAPAPAPAAPAATPAAPAAPAYQPPAYHPPGAPAAAPPSEPQTPQQQAPVPQEAELISFD
eukprot:Clim_evm12s134 gene=Clim_evmTU12s134